MMPPLFSLWFLMIYRRKNDNYRENCFLAPTGTIEKYLINPFIQSLFGIGNPTNPLGALNARFCRTYLFRDVLAAIRYVLFLNIKYSITAFQSIISLPKFESRFIIQSKRTTKKRL